MVRGLLDDKNTYVFGFEMIGPVLDRMSERDIEKISYRWCRGRCRLLNWFIELGEAIGKDNRPRGGESRIVKERCYKLLAEIRDTLSEDERMDMESRIKTMQVD